MIDWSKFIKAGFENESELLNANKDLNKNKAVKIAKDDELEVKWYSKDKVKYYTVVCRCGNNRLLYHDNGVRCHVCGRFHSHDNFSKKSHEAKNGAKFNDGKIAKIPQPMAVQRIELQKRRHVLTSRQFGKRWLGASSIHTNSS